jgi:hypothetical protein
MRAREQAAAGGCDWAVRHVRVDVARRCAPYVVGCSSVHLEDSAWVAMLSVDGDRAPTPVPLCHGRSAFEHKLRSGDACGERSEGPDERSKGRARAPTSGPRGGPGPAPQGGANRASHTRRTSACERLFVCLRTGPDQTRPDQTRPDQIRSDRLHHPELTRRFPNEHFVWETK